MTKAESKYFNTARIMDEALLDLLEKKNIQYISIKEICEKAGVNRSTFYLHYETIGDLLEETIAYIQEHFDGFFPVNTADFISRIYEKPLHELVFINKKFLEPYLNFVKQYQQVYRAAFNNPKALQADDRLASLFKTVLKPIFTRFGIPENAHRYWLVYHIDGVMAIITEWLKNNCRESVDEMIIIIEDCVRSGQVSFERECENHEGAAFIIP